jgi:hypothetical protein
MHYNPREAASKSREKKPAQPIVDSNLGGNTRNSPSPVKREERTTFE